MRYLALACDYDGTLATDGQVLDATAAAVERVIASGRKFILVTGRELDDLLSVFPRIDLCECVVAENGALLYHPSTRRAEVLVKPPPEELLTALRARGVPFSVGRSIIATWEPHETTVLETIRDLGLERQVIFNKGAVMVLPSGVNKATGLKAALAQLGLSVHNVVGIGDAENDHALLALCECGVAVANALPMLKEHADLVMHGDHGAGVVELIGKLLADDLQEAEPKLSRHHVMIGSTRNDTTGDQQEVRLPPYGGNILIAGSSGGGKSTLATAIMERMGGEGYQFCVIDPEGDYESFDHAVALGDSQHPPSADELVQLLKNVESNGILNLVGIPLADRPAFFQTVLPRLQELRTRLGRPHWLIIDEAHHLVPSVLSMGSPIVAQALTQTIFITVHPEGLRDLADPVMKSVETAIVVGRAARVTLQEVLHQVGASVPSVLHGMPDSLPAGEAVMWSRRAPHEVIRFKIEPGKTQRRRHRRKYAEGDLGADHSFYFTGPEGKLKLKAQNLILFMQIADGVDEETWQYHLRRGDYSKWLREEIKDDALADIVAEIESRGGIVADESRRLIKETITQHYTMPTTPLASNLADK